MSNNYLPAPAEARESLRVLETVRQTNAVRLRRPRSYWFMFASIMAAYAIIPLSTDLLPPLASYLFPFGLIMVIVLLAARRQPPAVRKIRFRGKMLLPFIAGVIVLGLIGGLNQALYSTHQWWWLPPVSAVLIFLLVLVGGRAMDRYWARTASFPEGRTVESYA